MTLTSVAPLVSVTLVGAVGGGVELVLDGIGVSCVSVAAGGSTSAGCVVSLLSPCVTLCVGLTEAPLVVVSSAATGIVRST